MMLRVLLVAPDQPGINSIPEIRAITGSHQVSVMNGTVTAQDIYQQARYGTFQAIHFATHSLDRVVQLSGGEALSPEDVAQIGRMAGAEMLFFNSCRSGLLADYAVRHGVQYAFYANVELVDVHAWKMPSAFYDCLSEQQAGEADYVTAFLAADSGEGIYGMSVAPDAMLSLHTILEELKRNVNDIVQLRQEMDRFRLNQRLLLVFLAMSAALSVLNMVLG